MISQEQKDTVNMIPNKLYELGQCLGLDKRDIDNVYSSLATKKGDASFTSPLEVYKDSCHYGTISIKDF